MRPNREFDEEAEGSVKPEQPEKPKAEKTEEIPEPERKLWKLDKDQLEVIELHYHKPHHFNPAAYSSWFYADLREKRPFYLNNKDLNESNGYFNDQKSAEDALNELIRKKEKRSENATENVSTTEVREGDAGISESEQA